MLFFICLRKCYVICRICQLGIHYVELGLRHFSDFVFTVIITVVLVIVVNLIIFVVIIDNIVIVVIVVVLVIFVVAG